MEQLIFLGIAILYGIGVALYRFVKWANRKISSSAAPNRGQQTLADAQRQAQESPTPQVPRPRQPQAGAPAAPREATGADIQRRKEELRVENERAYAHYRRRAEELRANEEGLEGNTVIGVALRSAAPAQSRGGLFQNTDDLVRAIILREALGPPLSRRSSPK